MHRLMIGITLVTALLALPTGTEAQEADQPLVRVYVAPIADFALGDDGPTRHEYIMHLRRAECRGIIPTSKEAVADYTVWFEFENVHFMTLWDAGNVIRDRSGG